MKKPVFYIPIGLPASGKSRFLSSLKDIEIVGGDRMRKELFGDENIQYTDSFLTDNGIDISGMDDKTKELTAHPIIWRLVDRKALELIEAGCDTAYDGVNSSRRVRKLIIDLIRGKTVIRAARFTADIDTCIARDRKRERTAGEAVIRRIAGNMEEPDFSEGFDIIDTYDENGALISHRTKEETI